MINKKNIIRIITIILLVSIILRFCLIVINLNHDCTHDDNCPICALTDKFKNDLNEITSNIKVLIVILLIFLSVTIYLIDKIRDRNKNTLVGLKVELIN